MLSLHPEKETRQDSLDINHAAYHAYHHNSDNRSTCLPTSRTEKKKRGLGKFLIFLGIIYVTFLICSSRLVFRMYRCGRKFRYSITFYSEESNSAVLKECYGTISRVQNHLSKYVGDVCWEGKKGKRRKIPHTFLRDVKRVGRLRQSGLYT